jgi:CBS domain containing-hemolysin-like protein
MTLSEFFAKCGDFMLKHGGTTYDVFDHVVKDDKKPWSTVFFTPYKSAPDFFYRASSVVSAPVFLSLLSIELAAVSFYLSLNSLFKLATLDPKAAKTRILDSTIHFLAAIAAAVAAFVSPFVNFVDFIGAGVTSMMPKKEESQDLRSAMP